MSKFGNSTPNTVKKASSSFSKKKNYDTTSKPKATFDKKKSNKPVFVKKQVPIAFSDYYDNCIDSLYNLLQSISFDLISIPVHVTKAKAFGDENAKGTIPIGNVVKFNNDNTFTIRIDKKYEGVIGEKTVMSVSCLKNRANDEVTYITNLQVTDRFQSIADHYKDIEEAFSKAEVDVESETNDTTIE